MAEVVFVDDEEHLRLAAQQSLELEGISVECFDKAAEINPGYREAIRDKGSALARHRQRSLLGHTVHVTTVGWLFLGTA